LIAELFYLPTNPDHHPKRQKKESGRSFKTAYAKVSHRLRTVKVKPFGFCNIFFVIINW
jgi:hypothetical protein